MTKITAIGLGALLPFAASACRAGPEFIYPRDVIADVVIIGRVERVESKKFDLMHVSIKSVEKGSFKDRTYAIGSGWYWGSPSCGIGPALKLGDDVKIYLKKLVSGKLTPVRYFLLRNGKVDIRASSWGN